MRIVLMLDGTRQEIAGGQYPAGTGFPRKGDELVVGAYRYLVTWVVWQLAPLDRHALTGIELHGQRIGAAS